MFERVLEAWRKFWPRTAVPPQSRPDLQRLTFEAAGLMTPIEPRPIPSKDLHNTSATQIHPTRHWQPSEANRDVSANFRVNGNAYVINRPRFRSLGPGFSVAGDLFIGGKLGPGNSHEQRRVAIVALPEGLNVEGSLVLRSCFRLRRFPTQFKIGRSILIADCDALEQLPGNLRVEGSFMIIGGRSLNALPAGLYVSGDFQLSGTRVTSLPDDLTVGGSLTIEGRSRVEQIPPMIQIGASLSIRSSKMSSLPKGLNIRQNLDLRRAKSLKTLPAGLRVAGNINLSDSPRFETIPLGLQVGGSLILRRCASLRSLPDGLEIPGVLNLRGCASLASLGRLTRVGTMQSFARSSGSLSLSAEIPTRRRINLTPALSVADCPLLRELPEDLEVFGPIDVAGSGLLDLPPSLQNAVVLWRGVLVPPDVVFHPDRLDPLQILQEANAELRRVMLERRP